MSRRLEFVVGGVFVAAAVFLHATLMGRAVIGLNVGLILTYLVGVARAGDTSSEPHNIISIYLVGVAVQCLHFGEEYLMGFQTKFPGLFGYRWSDELFVGFNLVWLFVFVLAAWGVLSKIRLAYLVVWFFALIGAVGNGIAHPALSLAQGGYFPGLITSPAHLVVGVLLIKRLSRRL